MRQVPAAQVGVVCTRCSMKNDTGLDARPLLVLQNVEDNHNKIPLRSRLQLFTLM